VPGIALLFDSYFSCYYHLSESMLSLYTCLHDTKGFLKLNYIVNCCIKLRTSSDLETFNLVILKLDKLTLQTYY